MPICPNCNGELIREVFYGVEVEGQEEVDVKVCCSECDYEEWD